MKKFTSLIILSCLTLLLVAPNTVSGQGGGNAIPAECNYTDGSCISIGYVLIQLIPGNPDVYEISVDYEINQGGENDCPEVRRIRFNPSHQNSGDIDIGDDEEIVGSATFRVVANAFEAQDRTLRMTIDYEDGRNVVVDLKAPETLECGPITPLPVELTSFEGIATESGISLEWETASEINNSHFDVERSGDGTTFESIGRIRGHGSTSVTSNYSLTDKDPKKGVNYYRLKQVDFDNTTSYSKAITVKWEVGDAMKISLVPNPCRNGDCNISLSNVANTETLVQLKDMAGRIIYSRTIKSDSHLLELPVGELSRHKGLFFLTATTGKQVVHSRIVLE
ncbi:T9SS type A sorting domain-containing protein [Pontibacter sp. H259]|uniref:T9SS type A sorting domain-containing protein n=1 Tax=Pontibacter sp. H259 TaxID=3133421 RepID=UPI0030C38897